MESYDNPMAMLGRRVGEKVVVRIRGDSEVEGVLVGYDEHLNMMLQGAIVTKGTENRQRNLIYMSESFELSIEIFEGEGQSGIEERQSYHAVGGESQVQFGYVARLQELVKTQNLLLEYEQKRKNERVKEIQYTYVNAFSNFLWSRSLASPGKPEHCNILNTKDLIGLEQNLPEELGALQRVLSTPQPIFLSNDIRAPQAFLLDFMNFFPNWHYQIAALLRLEVKGADRLEATFQSEYTLASKTLANLRLNDRVQRFCAQIFEGPLRELSQIGEELVVDFVGIYEKWSENVAPKSALALFFTGKLEGQALRTLRPQLEELFGKLRSQEEAVILAEEMAHFQRRQESIAFLLKEVGSQELAVQSLNLKLAWLVWKKVLANRKKLQRLAVSLVSTILDNYARIPSEVKFVVRCFHQIAEARFGQLRFDDLKSFFNKVVFSQLFFSQFMALHEAQGAASNVNLTLLALVSQKIMFGQHFYQKYKYGFFNPVIAHFTPKVRSFIQRFSKERIQIKLGRALSPMLLSLQTLGFLRTVVKDRMGSLTALQRVVGRQFVQLGSTRYPTRCMYVVLLEKPSVNYGAILRPSQKIKRTLIQFLLLVERVPERGSLAALLQQYRCSEEEGQGSRPSVQLYATYLRKVLVTGQLRAIAQSVEEQISIGRSLIQKTKIALEKQHNFATNLQKMYMKLLGARKKITARRKVQSQMQNLLASPLGFDYQLVDGKVCQSNQRKLGRQRTMKRCLHDIAEYFRAGSEGVDGLYHLFMERVREEMEKGVVSEHLLQDARSVLGERLYRLIGLENFATGRDDRLRTKMTSHKFINLEMLQLSQYGQEQQLILDQAGKLLERLKNPACPQALLKLLHKVTLVFQHVILSTGKAADINADVQIPLMMLVLVHSGLPNLHTLIEFIDKFCAQEANSSVLGQTLTLVKSVLFLIEELDHTKLALQPQKYADLLAQGYVIVQ